MSDESDHFWNILGANFIIQGNCPIQNYFANSLRKQKESQHSSQMKIGEQFQRNAKRTFVTR